MTIQKLYNLLYKAQNMVVGTDLENAYFDYLHYQTQPLEDGYILKDNQIKDLQRSAKAIIKMAKLSKEVKEIYG